MEVYLGDDRMLAQARFVLGVEKFSHSKGPHIFHLWLLESCRRPAGSE